MRSSIRALVVVPLVVTACTSVTPEGQKVRVTDDKRASDGCRYVGEVHAKGFMGDDQRAFLAENDAHNKLRNRAAKLGANLVILTWESQRGSTQRGEAFECTQPGDKP